MVRATITVKEAAELLEVGRHAVYEAIRADEFPSPVIRMGRRIVIPRQPLLLALGLTDDKPSEEIIAEMMEDFWRGYLDRLRVDIRELLHGALDLVAETRGPTGSSRVV